MKLYQYEHCPFCVRPRLVAGVKGIELEIVDLAYDDEKTPMDMIGHKMLPILKTDGGDYIPESLDICAYIDKLNGKESIFDGSNDKTVREKMDQLQKIAKYLTYPRTYRHPLNKKAFPTKKAIDYFKGPKEQKMAVNFDDAFIYSKKYLPELEHLLEKVTPFFSRRLEKIDMPSKGLGLSYDDILYFPVLRSLTLANDVLALPEIINDYLEKLSEYSQVKLYLPYQYQA